MMNKEGGDAGGDGFSSRQHQLRIPLQPDVGAPGGGEIIISVDDVIVKGQQGGERKPAKTGQDQGQPDAVKNLLGHKLFKSIYESKGHGRNSYNAQQTGKPAGGGTKDTSRKWYSWLYTDYFPATPSNLLFTIMACLIISLVTFLVCVATSRIVLEGCKWPMCIHRTQQYIRPGLNSSSQDPAMFRVPGLIEKKSCVFHRYVPHAHFYFIEVVHDYRSQWSALIEWRHGRRCMLFDMRRYTTSSDCPSFYPGSMDERLGVPAARSHLSLAFPRRFARHRFRPLREEDKDVLGKVGSVIATLCEKASLYTAQFVEVRMEDRLCRPATQRLVDNMLTVCDSSYKPQRSEHMSDPETHTVVLYENMDPFFPPLKHADSSGHKDETTGPDVEVAIVEGIIANPSIDRLGVEHHQPEISDLDLHDREHGVDLPGGNGVVTGTHVSGSVESPDNGHLVSARRDGQEGDKQNAGDIKRQRTFTKLENPDENIVILNEIPHEAKAHADTKISPKDHHPEKRPNFLKEDVSSVAFSSEGLAKNGQNAKQDVTHTKPRKSNLDFLMSPRVENQDQIHVNNESKGISGNAKVSQVNSQKMAADASPLVNDQVKKRKGEDEKVGAKERISEAGSSEIVDRAEPLMDTVDKTDNLAKLNSSIVKVNMASPRDEEAALDNQKHDKDGVTTRLPGSNQSGTDANILSKPNRLVAVADTNSPGDLPQGRGRAVSKRNVRVLKRRSMPRDHMESRRYFLWRGRVVRVCTIRTWRDLM